MKSSVKELNGVDRLRRGVSKITWHCLPSHHQECNNTTVEKNHVLPVLERFQAECLFHSFLELVDRKELIWRHA